MDAAEAGAGLHLAEASGFGREALVAQDFVVVARRAQGEGELAAAGERGVAGQAGEDLVEFKRGEGLFVHGRNCSRRKEERGEGVVGASAGCGV